MCEESIHFVSIQCCPSIYSFSIVWQYFSNDIQWLFIGIVIRDYSMCVLSKFWW